MYFYIIMYFFKLIMGNKIQIGSTVQNKKGRHVFLNISPIQSVRLRLDQNDSVHELSSSHIDRSEMIKSRNLVDHVKRLGAIDGVRGNFCRNAQCNFGYRKACYVQNYPVLTEICETGPHSTLPTLFHMVSS